MCRHNGFIVNGHEMLSQTFPTSTKEHRNIVHTSRYLISLVSEVLGQKK